LLIIPERIFLLLPHQLMVITLQSIPSPQDPSSSSSNNNNNNNNNNSSSSSRILKRQGSSAAVVTRASYHLQAWRGIFVGQGIKWNRGSLVKMEDMDREDKGMVNHNNNNKGGMCMGPNWGAWGGMAMSKNGGKGKKYTQG
jgi:hypothetical protein